VSSDTPNRDSVWYYVPWIVYAGAIVLVFGPFLYFVFTGWGNDPNSCLEGGDINCFCERVDIADVTNSEWGVRQPANTWSNLYALFTALVVVLGIIRDRKAIGEGTAPNLIKSRNLLADLFVFAVFFLGFGSMWFHASITQWGGKFDGMSMYAFVGYMVCYTLYRLVPQWWLFLIVYVALVATFTGLHNHVESTILVALIVGIYAVLEAIVLVWRLVDLVNGRWSIPSDWYVPLLWWLCGLGSFGLAFIFWKWGVREHEFCDPDSAFQWHGLWHVFAGIMAVFVYYYWRRVRPVIAPSD
jgi:hypothetical protein